MANEPKLSTGQVVKWQEREYPIVYSNIMGFSMTAFDISLVFGQVGEATPEEVKGIPQVKVLLSPEQATNLMKLLDISLKAYVEKHGEIRTSGAVNLEHIQRQMEEARMLATTDES
jgi:Protein of unknown function (DUF3467)